MWNKLYIIIDKDSIKPLVFWKFSASDLVIMCIGFCFGYFPFKALVGDFVGFCIGVIFFSILGFLFLEMPNHLTILQHLQMFYSYKYKMSKEYFYIPTTEIQKIDKEELDKETIEWNEYQKMIRENRNQ